MNKQYNTILTETRTIPRPPPTHPLLFNQTEELKIQQSFQYVQINHALNALNPKLIKISVTAVAP